ncbi:MAG: hypothetical protein MJA84_13465 [Firmicutes bacterium]|nr:hypothetical protein [Bacillota bacterium]
MALSVLLLWFLSVSPGTAAAAEDNDGPVEIVAELGWEGWGASGRHAPAVITIKNTGGRDLNGVIEALNYYSFTPPPQPGSPPGTVPPARNIPGVGYGQKISLPAGGEKKLTLWFPVHGPGSRVDFVFRAGDNELARKTTKMPGVALTGPQPMAVGVLGSVPPALERVRPLMPDGVYRMPQVQELSADLFPRRGEELDAFPTILVTAAGASTLDDRQRQALAGWVELGGRLLVGGGLNIEDALAALPDNTLDIGVESIQDQSRWQAEAAWLETTYSGDAGASVAALRGAGQPWGPDAHPLGLQFQMGTGTVTVLQFDPNQSPWRAGALGEALWAKVIAPEKEEKMYWHMSWEHQISRLADQTDNLPGDVFPDWRSVGLYLLIFIIVSGPVTYFVLRRFQRPEYTWLAVPLTALLFVGGVYAYMIQSGGNVLVNVTQVVDGRESSKTAGYTAVGYFAPTRADFKAVLDDPEMAVQVRTMGGPPLELMSEDNEPQYRIIRGSDLEVLFSDISQWNMRNISFRNDRLAEEAGGLTATVELRGNNAKGLVRNDTGMDLDYVTLFWGNRYKVLGDMKPGQEETVDMEITVPRYNPQKDFGHNTLWHVFQFPDGPPASPKPGAHYRPPQERSLTVEERRRVNLADSWIHSIRRHSPIEESGWPLTVLAWSDSPAGLKGIKQLHQAPSYLTLLVEQPEIRLTAGSFTIPAGLVIPEVTDHQVRSMGGSSNLTSIESGFLVLAFKPQLGQEVKINNITIGLDCFPYKLVRGGMGSASPNPSPVPPGVFEVYHPARGVWVEMSGSRTFELDSDYATADGEVRVKITGGNTDRGEGFYFLPPTIAYGGESQ